MSDTTLVRFVEESTKVISTGTIGPQGPPGPTGAQGIQGIQGRSQAVFGIDGDIISMLYPSRWRSFEDLTILGIVATVGEAPVGADLIIDVKKNGVSVFTGPLVIIQDGEYESEVVVPTVTNLSEGDILTIEVTQIGSTTPGGWLTLQILVS